MNTLSVELLHELLLLDRRSGDLTWKPRSAEHFAAFESTRDAGWRAARWNARHAGTRALAVMNQGYLAGSLMGRPHRAHRVVFAMVHGRWPRGFIDHINGNRSDNRPGNLREASNRENARNQKAFSTNTTGVPGVVWNRAEGKWKARINDDTGRRHLGTFSDFNDAVAARRAAEVEVGYHQNHGRP